MQTISAAETTPARYRAPFPPAAPPSRRIAEPGTDSDPLAKLATSVAVGKNDTIFYQDDDADHYYKVVSGTVRLCKITEDGRRQIATFLFPGDFFGWCSGDTHAYSAEAVTDARLEKLPRARTEERMQSDHQLGRRLMTLLSNQLASAHDHLLLLGRMTAKERIARFLIQLVKRQRIAPGAAGVELPMNRSDVADYLGLTVETVSRTLSGLRRKGVIDLPSAEKVRILHFDALEAAAA
jgi:CRP/FNR family transcriptional regulator